MFFFLPLLFLLFCSLIIRQYQENWRVAVFFAAVITAAALTALTEGLSLVQSLSFYPLLISWSLLTAGAGLKVISLRDQAKAWPSINFKIWFLSEKILLGIIIFTIVVTGITAAFSIPNTWDSMMYHLPRVEHWIQNKTVAFYPTNILRQLCNTPWSEFAITHVRILGGGPTSANFVQWFAMLGSLVGVSLIAGQLGANRTGQLMASTIAACLPTGVLEAVSTQTDYVSSFWLVVFVFFIIEMQRKFSSVNIIAAGISLGLAILTKGVCYIFAFPFLIWFVAANLKQRFFKMVLGLLLIIVCAVSLNMGQYMRNAQTFGSPAWTDVSLTNESFNLKVLWINVLRNMGLHLTTPLMEVNDNIVQCMTKAAQIMGADINDQGSNFGQGFHLRSMCADEDYTGNFLHFIFFTVIFVLSWFCPGNKQRTSFYTCAVVSAFLLFCLIVRFQDFNTRFHLPLFILYCPVGGVILERYLKQKSFFLAILFFWGAMPWLFYNYQHPWMGNESIWKVPQPVQYFYKRPYLAGPYVQITEYLKSSGCRQIGLLIDEGTWEYPWWGLLEGRGIRMEHVGTRNASASLKYPLGDFQPCVIIDSEKKAPPEIIMGNAIYGAVGTVPGGNDQISVFLKRF